VDKVNMDRLRTMVLDGATPTEVSERFGLAIGTASNLTSRIRKEQRAAADAALARLRGKGPTYPDVAKKLRLKEKAAEARMNLITAWRARHPEARCSDKAALALAEMEAAYRPPRSDA
jgi:transposase